MSDNSLNTLSQRAKRYSSLKYTLSFADIIYVLILLFLSVKLGISNALTELLLRLTPNKFLLIPLYFLAICIIYYLLDLPLNFYRTYILEHKFALSNQKLGDWFTDQIKSGVVSYIIGIILLGVFYYILQLSPNAWWLIVSLFWIFFSLILAKLMPVIIIPLFFKYKRLTDDTLRERIIILAQRMKIKILDVFEIDFSKKTLKANAAFVGVGSTKRVILADTLKDKYNHDEIEVILAHEFAHYKLRHLFKLILVNSLSTIFIFYIIFKSSSHVLNLFGFSSLTELAAMPIIFIYFVFFGIITQPFEALISRKLETNADMMALKETRLKEAFISMMEKLAAQNLADSNPHPLIKFFFFDHPPVSERILKARQFISG